MEAGAHLQQRAHPPVDLGFALGRLGDPGQDLQQRALAGPVAADHAQHLAIMNIEIDVLQRPETVIGLLFRQVIFLASME